VVTVPLVILAALAALGGALNLPGLHTFTQWIEHTLEFVQEGEFKILVAVVSTTLALAAIGISGWLYTRRYEAMQRLPTGKRPDDPLRSFIGPVFTWLKDKWYIDELYWAVILNPYIALSRFLAEVVDWRFWHDWFHERVILAGYNQLTRLLNVRVDLGGIDALANGLGATVQRAAASLRRVETGYVRNYALSIFLGVVLILGYLILH
jgi:NADH-quinone oxidoreductase subunit L